MNIGILQTGTAHEAIRAAHGEIDTWFHKLFGDQDFEFQTWMVVDGEFPDGPEAADGWLITGSPHGAYDDLPWIAQLEEFIREVKAFDIPMVGICFGHQIIAQALGGRVEKFSGGWAVGQQDYEMAGERVALNAWHQDQVTKRPAEAQLIASSEFCENAILAYGPRLLTVQAHPEFPEGFVADMIRHRGQGAVPEERLAAATARNGGENDNARLAKMLAETLRGGRRI